MPNADPAADPVTDRIAARFAAARADGRAALVVFVTVGHPYRDAALDMGDCLHNSGVSFNKSSTVVDVVSHLSLQVHLGPTGEQQLYHISTTIATGPHEGSTATLRNRMRRDSQYHM